MKVTLYTKDGCHLCEEAEDALRAIQPSIQFELELVYIEDDATLLDRYQDRVPVIALDGTEVASAPVDERTLRAALSV